MAAAAKSVQLCLTLRDPMDCSPPGSPIPRILQASTLEWVAISFSDAWKWKVKVKSFSHVRPSATPWTAAFQAPLSMGFSRQEYWSGVPLPSPKSTLDLQNQDVRVGLHLIISPGDSNAQWSLKNSGLEKQSPGHWQDLRIISGLGN